MSKSKLTLIIDGNWLLISRLSAICSRYLDDMEMCHDLQLLLVKSIKLTLKQFPQIDNVIFVSDGGSWRTNVEVPEHLVDENGEKIVYKGNREKSDDINWDVVFNSYEEFISILQQNGINAYRELDLEGDDWIWWWSTYLNSQGTNVIIWTKDNDLKQLVNIDDNKCFTVWWNKSNGMFTCKFDDSNLNFLFNNEYNENDLIFQQITRNTEVTQIDHNNIIIDKIIRGDIGDNIRPILYKENKNSKSSRKIRISQNDIDYSLDFNDDKAVYNYLKTLYENKKYKNKLNVTLDKAFEHFKYNRIMVALERQSYPSNIMNIFENYKDINISNNFDNIENQILAATNKLNGILDII